LIGHVEEKRRLEHLLRVSTNVLAALTVDEVLQRVVAGARELTGARFGAAGHGYTDGEGFNVSAVSPGEGVLRTSMAEVFLDLLKAKDGSIRLTARELMNRPVAGRASLGLLGAHLVGADGRPEGVILVADREHGDFEDEDETVLRQLATLTSLALQHIASRDEARRRAAEAEEGERILRALMEYIPEGIAIAEGPQVTIRMTSRYGQRMIARHPDETEDIPARDQGDRWNLLRLDGSSIDPNQLPLARAARRGELVTNEELMLQQPDGTTLPVSCNSGPILDRDGRIVGAVMAWRDITERKRAEEALLEANRRKDEFLALLAHELRNPLAPLVNAAEILRRGPAEAVGDEALAVVERQVWHMVRLIDDLLDVSRITRGKIRLQKARVDLALIVEASVAASQPLIEARRHRFAAVCPEAEIFLDADATRLTQVISNLLNNAAKYTPAGGEVDLVAERQGEEAVIRVRDSGVGIPEESLPRLFQMFAQVETAVNGAREGLGVGLALARELARMHGGTISVHSEGAGRGSEFVVRLPALPVADRPEEARPPPERELASGGLRILVVDDSEDSARSLGALLDMLGHEVIVAHGGADALEIVTARAPDVAVLDIGMPEMDGYELARRLRARYSADEMLLVAVTGWGKDEDRRRSQEAGFDHHLVKPAKPGELQRILDRFREKQSCSPSS
jgi:signal transduction histidine kinase/ActR/RegA family two-component response regulator